MRIVFVVVFIMVMMHNDMFDGGDRFNDDNDNDIMTYNDGNSDGDWINVLKKEKKTVSFRCLKHTVAQYI